MTKIESHHYHTLWRMLTPLLLTLLLPPWTCGCQHKAHSGEARQATENTLPRLMPFMTGPAAGFLTNDSGFSAHCEIHLENNGTLPLSLAGQLYVRGHLFRLEIMPGKYKPGRSEELGLIWNTSTHAGWVFSEALQGYAACQNDLEFTNVSLENIPGQSDKIDGRAVDHSEAAFLGGNGQKQIIQLARTLDSSKIPLEIRVLDVATNSIVLSLTKVEDAVPAAGLFLPPESFTQYPTAAALVAELATRQANYYGGGGIGAPPSDNWQPPPPRPR